MRNSIFPALRLLVCAVVLTSSGQALAEPADEEVAREPAQAPAPPATKAPVAPEAVQQPIEAAPRSRRPRFQFSLMGGFAITGRDDLDPQIYKHEASRSPVGRFAFHYAFFTDKPFNLLLGAEIIAARSVEVASSPSATASYTTDDVYVAPSVGFGWSPAGPGTMFQLQGILATGSEVSHTATLESPGFTTDITKHSITSLAAWYGLYGVFSVTPQWRLIGGFSFCNKITPFMVGGAYAF